MTVYSDEVSLPVYDPLDPSTYWAHPDQLLVPVSAVRAAVEIDQTSGRRRATPVRKRFVRSDRLGSAPPMARLYQAGGRSGTVALKLYLALLWRCSGEPFETQKPHRAWATLLGLDDPSGKGARRIAEALKALERAELVTIRRAPGAVNVVRILDESGSGDGYALPSTTYAKAPAGPKGDSQRAASVYFKIPSRLWLQGHIQSLKGPGLVLLLILLAEQSGEGAPVWFSTTTFPDRYRISHKTRAAGTRELEQRKLLGVEPQRLPDHPGQSALLERVRIRKVYTLTGAARASGTPAIEEINAWLGA